MSKGPVFDRSLNQNNWQRDPNCLHLHLQSMSIAHVKDKRQKITRLLTTADFNAFHVLNNFQLAQIKNTNYETTLQKMWVLSLSSERDILNLKIPEESVKNLHFIQLLSIRTNPAPNKDQMVIKIWQWKRSERIFRPGITADQGPLSSPIVDLHPYSFLTLSPQSAWPHANYLWTKLLLPLLQMWQNSGRDHAHHLSIGISRGQMSGLCPNSM